MWLSTLLLVFFGFQCYLFLVVLKCSLYLNVRTDFDFPLLITHAEILQTVRMEKNIRKMQFQEVSDRVRRAKENGLWRSTSWGGGFQQVYLPVCITKVQNQLINFTCLSTKGSTRRTDGIATKEGRRCRIELYNGI